MEKEQFKIEVLPLRGKLMTYARRLLESPEDVEDVAQEVFLKLWDIRGELDRYNSVEALAVTMTRNACLNKIRIYQMHREVTLTDSIAESGYDNNPDTIFEQRDELGYLMNIMGKLPRLQQAVLKMKHVDGLEVREIAELIGSTPENVRVNLSRARKKVRELFF